VVDVACRGCRSTIGWHYLHAYEPTESYKIGKYVLEKVWLAKSDVWRTVTSRATMRLPRPSRRGPSTPTRSPGSSVSRTLDTRGSVT
jgi:hypothetical protein